MFNIINKLNFLNQNETWFCYILVKIWYNLKKNFHNIIKFRLLFNLFLFFSYSCFTSWLLTNSYWSTYRTNSSISNKNFHINVIDSLGKKTKPVGFLHWHCHQIKKQRSCQLVSHRSSSIGWWIHRNRFFFFSKHFWVFNCKHF